MDPLESRVRRLEVQNRVLLVAVAGFALLFVLGFQGEQVPDVARAKKIEVVDQRGVPIVTLGASREGGGEMVIRDETGDRRAWLSSGHGAARLGMVSGAEESPSSALGLSVEPGRSHLGLTGGKASASAGVDDEQPTLELNGKDGRVLFAAPWRKR